MSDLVAPDQIETIVGASRHPVFHYVRAVSAEQTVYILHSQLCKDSTPDLRDCPFSLALDRGIDSDAWDGFEDKPVIAGLINQRLVPLRPAGPISGWL